MSDQRRFLLLVNPDAPGIAHLHLRNQYPDERDQQQSDSDQDQRRMLQPIDRREEPVNFARQRINQHDASASNDRQAKQSPDEIVRAVRFAQPVRVAPGSFPG
jgi:hypothetical protein